MLFDMRLYCSYFYFSYADNVVFALAHAAAALADDATIVAVNFIATETVEQGKTAGYSCKHLLLLDG